MCSVCVNYKHELCAVGAQRAGSFTNGMSNWTEFFFFFPILDISSFYFFNFSRYFYQPIFTSSSVRNISNIAKLMRWFFSQICLSSKKKEREGFSQQKSEIVSMLKSICGLHMCICSHGILILNFKQKKKSGYKIGYTLITLLGDNNINI